MPITTQHRLSRQAAATTMRKGTRYPFQRFPTQKSQFSLRQRANASDAVGQLGTDDNQPYDPLRSMPASLPGNQGTPREGGTGAASNAPTPMSPAESFAASTITNPAMTSMLTGKMKGAAQTAVQMAPYGIDPLTASLYSVANPASFIFSAVNTGIPAGIASQNLAEETQSLFDNMGLTEEQQKEAIDRMMGKKTSIETLSPEQMDLIQGVLGVESKIAKEEATPYMTKATTFLGDKVKGLLGLDVVEAMKQSDAQARQNEAERQSDLDADTQEATDAARSVAEAQSDAQARENEAQYSYGDNDTDTGGGFDSTSDPTGMGSEAEAAADAGGSDSDSDSDSGGGSWFCTAVSQQLDVKGWDTLSQFRRMAQTYYPDTLKFYVDTGPEVTKHFNQKDLQHLLKAVISPVIEHMKAGDFDSAFFHYAKYVLYYMKKYVPEKTKETIKYIVLARAQWREDIPTQ